MIKGPDIKEKRKALGLTVSQLADNIGVSKANLYKWEKGHIPSNPEDYRKLEQWMNGMENVPRDTKEPEKLKDILSDINVLRLVMEEKEATRKYLEEALRREMARSDKLLELLEQHLMKLQINSGTTIGLLESVLSIDRADHNEMLDNQDRAAGVPEGTSSTRSGNTQLASAKVQRDMGKRRASGK